MELRQIRHFLALCKDGTFTRAADRCGVSQPSLSNSIKKLEAKLGGPLFERGHKTSRLSALGRCVRPHLAAVDHAAAVAKDAAASFLVGPMVLTHNVQERSMRKIIYGAAFAAGVLLVAAQVIHPPKLATATQFKASQITDVRTLMTTVDIKALPRLEILSEADE
jgi:Bacterial regulatory helix-turn-helix protein, lysR family